MKRLALLLALFRWPPGPKTIASSRRTAASPRREITIKAGDSLTFTNDDEFIHQMYSDGLFDSDERRPGQT